MLNCLNLTNHITPLPPFIAPDRVLYLVPSTFLRVVAAKSLVECE